MMVLDSNTIIHYLRGHPDVVERFQSTPRNRLAIPTIVAYEVEYGTKKVASQKRAALVGTLLSEITQLPFDEAAAIEAVRIRLDLENKRSVIGPMDLLIAATALSRSATLVTNNTREFSRVKGLHLEDWTA